MPFDPGARGRLTAYDLPRFPDDTLFDRIGRTLCHVGRLPRKELFEAWEVARRVRRRCRGGRIVDAAGGHGLLAHLMLLLDDSSPSASVVDRTVPQSARPLHEAFAREWPRLRGRIDYRQSDIAGEPIVATDVVVSCHACGAVTDRVLDAALGARARVAVLPCCHDLDAAATGPLTGWLDGPTAIDVMRAVRLRQHGYDVRTQRISNDITPKNRLLVGIPQDPVLRA
jgi:hypothetical protein